MLPNDEDKKISIENETRDAARIRLERRQASKKTFPLMMIFSIFRGAVLIEPRMPEMPVEIMPVAIILIHGCMAGRFVPIIVVFVISRLRCRLSRRFRGLLSFVSLRFLLSFR